MLGSPNRDCHAEEQPSMKMLPILLGLVVATTSRGAELYVAPNGNDANPGTRIGLSQPCSGRNRRRGRRTGAKR